MHIHEAASMDKRQSHNSLIVDKDGLLGESLAESLASNTSVVLVTKRKPQEDSSIIYIPFSETIPRIPDGLYSTIVYVFAEESKDLLDPLMQKASTDKVLLLLVVSYDKVPLLSEQLQGKSVYGHVVVIGDLFGKGEGELDEWLIQAKTHKKVILPNMGLRSWYPVLFEDATQAILELCNMQHVGGKQLYVLAPSHAVTQITLSHALQKADPMLRVDFGKDEKLDVSALPHGSTLLKEYSATEKIVQYYHQLHITNDVESFSLFSSQPKMSERKKKKRSVLPWLVPVYTLIIFAVMPILLMLSTGALGRWLLLSGIDDMRKGDFPAAIQKMDAAYSDISLSQVAADISSQELSPLGQSYRLNNLKQELSLATLTVNTLKEGIDAVQNIQLVIEGKSLKPTEDAKKGANALKEALVMLQTLQTYNLPQEYRGKLALLNAYIPFTETAIDSLPQLLGTDGDRKYLVLFQNNTELRPGGGFIGSYGLLQLSHGKFISFTIHDVYDADGQLKGHVEPPFAIRRYIPVPHLYLRDSNFDIDFVKGAQKASFMLNAETGDTVDGVVGVDLSFVQKLVGALGNIYVPSTKDTVTADNFFMLTEQHAEKNFFAGSTQKRDFLSALFSVMQDRLTGSKVAYEKIFDEIIQGLSEKHVLFAFSDPSIQAPFSVNGFSSALLDTRVSEQGAVDDFLGISEANVGGNKVNYFVKRNVSQKVLITEKGQVQESVSLTLQNTSNGQWPGGDYKNYIRFILPKGATLEGISLNGKDQKLVAAVIDPKIYEAAGFVAPNGLEIDRSEENGKSVYGFFVDVPVNAAMQIIVSYSLSDSLDLTQTTPRYSLQLFKQPGLDEVPYSLEIELPEEFRLLKSSEKVQSNKSVISWSNDVRKDTVLNLSLAKNN